MGDESHRNLLKHSKVFDALSDEQLDRVVALGQVESFPEGAVIVEEDKAGKSCYFLIQGRVDIEIRSPFGGSDKVQKIATIKRGEMFGELSLVDGFLRSASAPVLICTPTSSQPEGVSRGPFQRILVPLDGSECAGQIVPLAGAMAFLCEATSRLPSLSTSRNLICAGGAARA